MGIDPAVVGAIFKAYDVRGRSPEQLDDQVARAIGCAFAEVVGSDRNVVGHTPQIVVGHDMRTTSPGLARAFAEGATEAGADAVLIGLASTDQLYFASGHLELPGAMITASHNPAGDNGIKMCRASAVPLGSESGLNDVRDRVLDADLEPSVSPPGTIAETDVLDAYASFLIDLAPVQGRPLTVVADAGNGMAGHTAPAVLGRIENLELIPLYFELDGTFPNHVANPLDDTTLTDLRARVRAEGADVGLAFDGDADRCFLVDERGETVSPSALTALIARRELAREPGASIIHNLITSRAVPEIVTEAGGVPVRTRVGHSFIKNRMAETGAVFGGEHSGHFYFRDFWRADSGMLAALHALAALAESDLPLSELMAPFGRYVSSGEINIDMGGDDAKAAAMAGVRDAYVSHDGVASDDLDGLTLTHRDWTVNLRPSNTEPVLRLNVEGADEATMTRMRDDVLHVVRNLP